MPLKNSLEHGSTRDVKPKIKSSFGVNPRFFFFFFRIIYLFFLRNFFHIIYMQDTDMFG